MREKDVVKVILTSRISEAQANLRKALKERTMVIQHIKKYMGKIPRRQEDR